MSAYYLLKVDYNFFIAIQGGRDMATNKRAFTLRLPDELLDKIGVLAEKEHRSMNNYIECILQKHLDEIETEQGEIKTDQMK